MNSTRARFSFAILVLLTLGGAVGCASTPRGAPPQDFAARFAGPIERAHGMDRWRAAEAVRTELTVVFGGKQSLAGTLLFETKGARSRIDTVDGATLVFDGAAAWVTPADAAVPRARFHLLTWPYFLAAPMKLRDPGTTLTDRGAMLMGGERLPAATLTFGAGVGDTPDDWYVAYRDLATDRLRALAYIVTYGKTREAAERRPHCATYDGLRYVDGAWLPSRIRIWNWSADRGVFGEPVGEVLFGDLAFVTPPPDAFVRPDGARADPLPTP